MKTGGKVLGRRKREHHLNSLITAPQSLIGESQREEASEEERNKWRKTGEGKGGVLVPSFL